MLSLTKSRANIATERLEDVLTELEKYGLPRVSKHDSGWVAYTKMRVHVAGAEYEIRAQFGHRTPLAAARECLTRVQQAVRGGVHA